MKPKWTPRPDIKPGDIIGKPAGWTPESDLDHFMMRTAGLANGRSRSPVPVAAQHQARNTSDRQRRRRCEDGEAAIYSRNGADLTRRFRALKPVIDAIPAKSAIIDCELVACDETGMPSFHSLMNLGDKAPALYLWCFDLLSLDGADHAPAVS